MHRHRGLSPNRGRPRARRRPASDHTATVLCGSLLFVDGAGRWAAMAVRDTSAQARRLVGRTLTLDLKAARLMVDDRNADGVISTRDLLPGDQVRITARLPRPPAAPPPVVAVRRITAWDPAVAT